MQVFRDLEALPNLEGTIVTVGSFDGVHIGHKKIINRIKQLSQKYATKNVVITFHPHPRSIVYPKDKTLRLLSSLQEKIELFRGFGIDYLVIVPFTIEFSQLSPTEYIEKLLVNKFKPSHIVIGYDHRFGINREGDISLLKIKSADYGYEVVEIEKQEIDAITISSTKIRNALIAGDLRQANTLLSYPYCISGKVVEGRKVGTDIGYPTANIQVESDKKLIPKDGIYTCYVVIKDHRYKGMMYIGDIPTIKGKNPKTIEVNIFDFDQNIYGERISVQLLKFLREDKKFDGLEGLKTQLAQDKLDTISFFESEIKPVNLDATIAILNYNAKDYLETFLPSVSHSSQSEFDILVIDNASDDDPREMLEEWFPEIAYLRLDKNYGFAEGYNKGLVNIKSKYVVLLNSDVKVTEGWLDPLITYLEEHNEYGAVMPKILSLEDPSSFEYAGAAGGFMDELGYPYCRGRIFNEIEKDNGQYDNATSIFWVSGAACVIRTEVFKQLGGFDADYFAHQEEIDLCWRMHRAGYKLAVLPESKVYHLGGGTLNYGSSFKVYLNFRNSLANIFKNESILNLLWKIPTRLVLDGIAGLKFLMSGQINSFLAVIKAHFAFYLALPSLFVKRRKYSKNIEKVRIGQCNKDGLYHGSIVFKHFFGGLSSFSDL